MFLRLWQFHVRPNLIREFCAAYGPDGEWAALFRRGSGYVGTELLEARSVPATYLSIDRWGSREAWDAFLRAH